MRYTLSVKIEIILYILQVLYVVFIIHYETSRFFNLSLKMSIVFRIIVFNNSSADTHSELHNYTGCPENQRHALEG